MVAPAVAVAVACPVTRLCPSQAPSAHQKRQSHFHRRHFVSRWPCCHAQRFHGCRRRRRRSSQRRPSRRLRMPYWPRRRRSSGSARVDVRLCPRGEQWCRHQLHQRPLWRRSTCQPMLRAGWQEWQASPSRRRHRHRHRRRGWRHCRRRRHRRRHRLCRRRVRQCRLPLPPWPPPPHCPLLRCRELLAHPSSGPAADRQSRWQDCRQLTDGRVTGGSATGLAALLGHSACCDPMALPVVRESREHHRQRPSCRRFRVPRSQPQLPVVAQSPVGHRRVPPVARLCQLYRVRATALLSSLKQLQLQF